MKRILLMAALGTTPAYSAQSTTATTTTTTNTTTATVTAATTAYIYQHLLGQGVAPQEALTQAQEWHPPMVIPFTNPEQEGEQAIDNAE